MARKKVNMMAADVRRLWPRGASAVAPYEVDFSPAAARIGFAMREWTGWPWLREAALALAIGVAAAALGPYGTGALLAPTPRVLYWVALIGLGWGQFVGTAFLLERYGRLALPARIVATIAGASLPLALELTFINAAVFGAETTLGALGTAYLQAALVGALILVPMSLLRRTTAPPTAEPRPAAASGARFLARIPATLGGRLLALEMEDHYLRIYTDSGSALILLRISDAVAELDGVDGWRVHRSWWVAAEAVTSVRREKGGRTTLRLANGLVVPVSRGAASDLRERLRGLPAA
jgi:hypothetical protein